jgi:hypothetical protein
MTERSKGRKVKAVNVHRGQTVHIYCGSRVPVASVAVSDAGVQFVRLYPRRSGSIAKVCAKRELEGEWGMTLDVPVEIGGSGQRYEMEKA